MVPKIPNVTISLVAVKMSALDYRDLHLRYLNVSCMCEVGV